MAQHLHNDLTRDALQNLEEQDLLLNTTYIFSLGGSATAWWNLPGNLEKEYAELDELLIFFPDCLTQLLEEGDSCLQISYNYSGGPAPDEEIVQIRDDPYTLLTMYRYHHDFCENPWHGGQPQR